MLFFLFFGEPSFLHNFKLTYEKDIFNVLSEAGDCGLSAKKIARHVFNVNNSFFNEVSEDDVKQTVRRYLYSHSRKPSDMIEQVGHGVYRLNVRSQAAVELFLQFEDDEEPQPKPKEDKSLSLF